MDPKMRKESAAAKTSRQKRLLAVPWATMCIRCQEETEKVRNLSDLVMAGLEEEMDL
jgi:RNA polymerase-binding transcription factor DksA